MVTAMEITRANAYKRSVVSHYRERIEGQEERTDDPKKVKKWDADNKLDGDQYIGDAGCGKKEYRSRRAQSGSRAFARNQQCIDAAQKRVRNAKRVADNHDESGGENHARHCHGPAWIRSEFVFQELP